MIDVQLGYIQAFENIEIFKVQPRWSKSLRLLQRVVFLVYFTFYMHMQQFFFERIL